MSGLETNNENDFVDSSIKKYVGDVADHPQYITLVKIPQLIKERPSPPTEDPFLKLLLQKKINDQRFNTLSIILYQSIGYFGDLAPSILEKLYKHITTHEADASEMVEVKKNIANFAFNRGWKINKERNKVTFIGKIKVVGAKRKTKAALKDLPKDLLQDIVNKLAELAAPEGDLNITDKDFLNNFLF
jgi:hypothetical protein